MQEAIQLLRRIDSNTLRELVGGTIVSAVEEVQPADMERQLAEILFLKHGHSMLDNSKIRQHLISSLTLDSAKALAESTDVKYDNQLSLYSKLQSYFKSYSEKKSAQLVTGLGLNTDYIKKHEPETRSGAVKVTAEYGEKAVLKGYLHPYQKSVKDQVTNHVLSNGQKQIMVQMPTGAGKTYTALESVVDILRAKTKPQYIVWLVNSNELAEQALEAFVNLWRLKGDRELYAYRFYSGLGPDVLYDHSGVIFSSFPTYNSIINDTSHRCRSALDEFRRKTSLVIVDEAHTSPAETYMDSIESFLSNAEVKLVGLTATPGRNSPEQTVDLVDLFQSKLIQITNSDGTAMDDPVSYLQSEKYLAEINITPLDSGITIENKNEKSVRNELAANPQRNKKILDQIELAHEQGQSTIVFACTLNHVYALRILCESKNIPCRLIVGDTTSSERVDILQDFKDEKYNVLINYDILSTGVDLPNVDKIIITRPIGSPILFSQILGRALRGPKNGGNQTNEVITINDNILNHDSAQMLFQLYWESWGL